MTRPVEPSSIRKLVEFLNADTDRVLASVSDSRKLKSDLTLLRDARDEVGALLQTIAKGRRVRDAVDRVAKEINRHIDPRTYIIFPTGRAKGTPRAVVLGKLEYAVRTQRSWTDSDPPAYLYNAILESFENGSLSRLRYCVVCNRFFYPRSLSRKFCSDRCTAIYFARGAAKRQRQWRANKKEQEKKDKIVSERKKVEKRLGRFLELAAKTPAGGNTNKLIPVLKIFGNGDRLKGWEPVGKLLQVRHQKPMAEVIKEIPASVRRWFAQDVDATDFD